MTDIFQEVEEDIRRERLKRLWDRYGLYLIGVAVLVVVLTAGWRGYVAWQTSRAEAAGDRFVAAVEAAESAGGEAAIAGLGEIAATGPDGYRLLARFRLASAEAEAGNLTAAIAGVQGIGADPGIPELYRGLARIRAAYLFLDSGDPRSAAGEVAVMAEQQTGPWLHPAQEVMGLAAYAEGNLAEARRWFSALEADPAVPAALRGRSQLMVSLLQSRLPAEEAAAATVDGDAAADGSAIR